MIVITARIINKWQQRCLICEIDLKNVPQIQMVDVYL